MTDRFDLEQQILACWGVTSDIDDLFEEVMENSDFTKDQITNVLLGLNAIYEIKFNKLFRTFEQMIKERQFAVPDSTFGSAYIAPLNARSISDAEFDAGAERSKKVADLVAKLEADTAANIAARKKKKTPQEYVESLELPPPVTTKAKKKAKK